MMRITMLSLSLSVLAGAAVAFGHEDWPCAQRKVDNLSWGQVWSGPPLPENARWREDPVLADLVPRLTARRTDMGTVETLLEEVEATADEDRNARLVRLFTGVFNEINVERKRLIDGIVGYAQKQRGLSEKIDAMRSEISTAEATAAPDDFDALDKIDEMNDALYWDTRIYQERLRSLTYVCESPVILEKRVFSLAQLIQQALE